MVGARLSMFVVEFIVVLVVVELLSHLLYYIAVLLVMVEDAYANGTYISNLARPRGYKTFFMLNSSLHEISLGHKNKNT